MWMPTHVQVTVQKASGLLTKGKNNSNDCFVTIALGKTKFQTSVKEKAASSTEWFEECELPIPDQGNTAEIILTALHRNFMGVDEFLGRVAIPLQTLDIYERPKNRWYVLQSKQGQEGKVKERGQLEVKIGFTVKSGSLNDLSKKEKHKSSIGQLSHAAQSVGGSLLSIGSIEKRKGIKKFAKSLGSKMHLKSKKKEGDVDDNSSVGSVGSLGNRTHISEPKTKSKQTIEDADPGVVSEDDEFTFDDLSHKSSGSSLNQTTAPINITTDVSDSNDVSRRHTISTVPPKPPRADAKSQQDEWDLKLYGNKSKNLLKPNSTETLNRRSWESPKLSTRIEEEEDVVESPQIDGGSENGININKSPVQQKVGKDSVFSKFKNFRKEKSDTDLKSINTNERIIIGGENEIRTMNNRVSNELLQKFEGKSREDVILLACELQNQLDHNKKKLKDLEDYLDELLLRVMETTPRILQNPYIIAHQKLAEYLK